MNIGPPSIHTIEPRVLDFILRETEGAACVVEFGAGKFEKIWATHAPLRYGIEICQDYIRDFCPEDVVPIWGDMREFQDRLPPLPSNSVAMFIDSVEHIEKDDGLELLKAVVHWFRKVIVFVPAGVHLQTEDPWGYGNEWQRHRSTWVPADLEALGFRVTVAPKFHGDKGDAMFGVWP